MKNGGKVNLKYLMATLELKKSE